MAVKSILKQIIANCCGRELQHKIRRYYAVRQIVHGNQFREPEMQVIRSVVNLGDHVADIGANVGVYTLDFSVAVGLDGRVYSFEPVDENYDILIALVAKLGLDNVTTFHAALGSETTKGEIVIPQMDGFRGFYWAHLADPNDAGRREKVEVLKLDDLYERGAVDTLSFIKCDVEGSELEVLRGAVNIVNACRPTWLMEISRKTSVQVFDFFKDLGYEAFVYRGCLTPTNAYRDGEFSNYFFFHKTEKPLGR